MRKDGILVVEQYLARQISRNLTPAKLHGKGSNTYIQHEYTGRVSVSTKADGFLLVHSQHKLDSVMGGGAQDQ